MLVHVCYNVVNRLLLYAEYQYILYVYGKPCGFNILYIVFFVL